jgi:hypothetical protein
MRVIFFANHVMPLLKLISFLFFLQEDNFVLSAIFCAIEEGNLEGLDKLLSMANIDVNQVMA